MWRQLPIQKWFQTQRKMSQLIDKYFKYLPMLLYCGICKFKIVKQIALTDRKILRKTVRIEM